MNTQINRIISQVLSGDATSEDIQHLLRWFNESDDNPKEFAKYEMLWNALEIIGRKHEYNFDSAYRKFIDQVEKPKEGIKSVSLFVRLARIAAIVIFAAGSAFLWGYHLRPTDQSAGPMCSVTAPKGSKAFAELPDGTRVWLNAESKLSYSGLFSGESRHVYLEGESYFEVAKDKKRPFIVHTSGLDIRAIGTAFNVKSYPSEDIIQTTLIEGEVAIEKQNGRSTKQTDASGSAGAIYLKPNQQATYFKTTSVIDVNSKTSVTKTIPEEMIPDKYALVKKDTVLLAEKVDIGLFTSWKENKLVFDNEPFESISVRLERQFNMKFRFMEKEIRSFRFTGKFNEISVEQLLAAMQFASPFYYIIVENEIFISLKPIKKV